MDGMTDLFYSLPLGLAGYGIMVMSVPAVLAALLLTVIPSLFRR